MIREASGESPVDEAVKRLERAIAELEQRLRQRSAPAPASDPDADADRVRLAAELEQARARERELEEAGAQASEALGRAIAEIRAALGESAELATEEA
jgi:uncharacterized protein (DUF3084 family)